MSRLTRRGLLGLLAIGLVAAVPASARAADATGTWKWSFTGQDGQTRETTLKLKQDGEKLTGTISGRQNDTEIEDGKVKDGDVSFKVVREFNGNKITQSYKGKLDGDAIKGKIEMDRNGETVSRDWEAKREK